MGGVPTKHTAEIARRAPELSMRNQKLVLDLIQQLARVSAETGAEIDV
jgi:hypothetical protein